MDARAETRPDRGAAATAAMQSNYAYPYYGFPSFGAYPPGMQQPPPGMQPPPWMLQPHASFRAPPPAFPPSGSEPELPEGWEKFWSKSRNCPFYYHRGMNTTSWDPPQATRPPTPSPPLRPPTPEPPAADEPPADSDGEHDG